MPGLDHWYVDAEGGREEGGKEWQQNSDPRGVAV